jgi:hypothetical protein
MNYMDRLQAQTDAHCPYLNREVDPRGSSPDPEPAWGLAKNRGLGVGICRDLKEPCVPLIEKYRVDDDGKDRWHVNCEVILPLNNSRRTRELANEHVYNDD